MSSRHLLFDKQKNRQLLALALPMILSNITVPLLGLVDTAVIGHLSNAYYLGGVAVGSTIITLIFWLLGFLRMSTTGLVAQAFGANDIQKQYRLLLQSASLALCLGVFAILLQTPIMMLASHLSDASTEVQHYSLVYFQTRIWSAPFALLNLALLGWLLGRQQPKAAMWQLIAANLTNIGLDLLFVIGLQWGVQGAALASVIADIVGFLVAATMVYRVIAKQGGFNLDRLYRSLNFNSYRQLLGLNRDIFIRSLCLQLTFTFMTFKGAALGDNVVAANAVLLNLVLLISYALDGIAYYAEAEVGRAYGENNRQRMTESVSLAFYWSAIAALLFSLTFALWGEQLIALLTSLSSVREYAEQYLDWVILMPLLAFACYLFDGVYIGAAKGKIMRNSMMLSTFMVFFPVWLLLQPTGNHALWAAMSLFMLARSLSLALHYHLRLKQQLG
ncbi:MATE family efflux transporter DinF [Shewanella sp. Isolate11]|uniref:MATE family efflux transporter DinF n=1 Tax=Shewanella sp. Isolate11 TaxID=2908530 RepID=UPI001EFDD5B4|nr:MATE family efflux transporter DinF [Shewanella sp. Isolate11]MCG9698050.1 MATE family efflux transporter DinF [Shewanella sp. Isolate11]